jgi:EAL domain-containing protein (putative c-di-GMP-specific phosphodiesterase class I)
MEHPGPPTLSCGQCLAAAHETFDLSMAFQPIVRYADHTIFAYEALVRSSAGASAAYVLSRVNDANRYFFDQACRVKAIEMASRLGIATHLSINFLPKAVYRPERCIRTTLEAAALYGLPLDRLIFEVVESEEVKDVAHLAAIFHDYRQRGMQVALDDFGTGYSNLSLLEQLAPDEVKLDISLVRGVAASPSKRAVVRAVTDVCRQLGAKVVAEGVESPDDLWALLDIGVELFQGFLFSRPGFEELPLPSWPAGR